MQLKKLNVVAIGGGHGLGKVLASLSFLDKQLTGIVATTDNGGSTGRLRKHTSSIAWGDLRNCLTHLVDKSSIGNKLFNFRFNGPNELDGHNLGNLILYALAQIHTHPLESIDLVRRLLRVKTRVLPMSETPTDLMAFYPQGRCRVGELSVDEMPISPQNLILAPAVKSLKPCIDAIYTADLIILGPGSFFTSIMPPLLVRDISNALKNRNGHCVFLDNIIPEHSPAAKLSLDEKLLWIEDNIGCLPIDSVICQNKAITSTKVNVFCEQLAHDETPHYHDSALLIKALKKCITELKISSQQLEPLYNKKKIVNL
ncbi:MAG: uridine diphosphate-N-acetylglucosamine-binding protein YvcK [Alteromonadaceae bacterium]|nr:uridine diphosphate-N-acetylglucosamine-binding protein YvcK [Alteromonadaceae bacterium]